MNEKLQITHDHFVEKMGFLGTLFGFNKLIGQIYGVLYLSPNPMSLNDLMGKLHVSKGSVSVNIRELEKWGGCKKVWVKGDRRDYYEAETNFRNIINKRLMDAIKRRISVFDESSQILNQDRQWNKGLNKEEKKMMAFYRKRIKRINKIRGRIDFIFKTVIKLV